MTTVWSAATSSSTAAPIKGGLVRSDNDSLAGFTLIPFVGTDPDAKVNVFSWDPTYMNPPTAAEAAPTTGNWTCMNADATFTNQQEPVSSPWS